MRGSMQQGGKEMFEVPMSVVALSTTFMIGASTTVVAQEKYPSKEVHIICGFPRGNGADILIRYLPTRLAKRQVTSLSLRTSPALAVCGESQIYLGRRNGT
jgi:hypothetical protein